MGRQADLVETEVEAIAIDTSNDSVTVTTGPCIYYGHAVTTTLSAHIVLIKDGSTTISTIVASSAAGLPQMLPVGIRCSSLVVDPDNSSTGNIVVFVRRVRQDGDME